MASIYYLNQPSHPFWDFVSNLEDHHFRGPPPHHAHPHPHPHFHTHFHPRGPPPGPHHQRFQDRSGNENVNENVNEGAAPPRQQAAAGSANEAGAAPTDNAAQQSRGLGESEPSEGLRGRHGRRDRSRGREHRFRGGCHAGFGPGPGLGRGGWGGRGWGHHARGRFGAAPFPGGQFDLHAFLERLGGRLGIDIDEMWRRYSGNDQQVDFVPRADIFDTASEYVVHVSLPGAQKPDISVNYDVDESVLHLAGVVYRPGINEELNDGLVVDGRSREVGVFEREVKLGTRSEPANVDVDKISAKLADGILVVRLPKVPVDPERLKKKKVSVEAVDEKKSDGSVNELDGSDAMHVDSETEKGDAPEDFGTEAGEATTLLHASSEDEDYDEEDGKEYVKVDVK